MSRIVQIVSAPSILGLTPSGVENLAGSLLAHGLQVAVGSKEPIIHVATLTDRYQSNRVPGSAVLNEQALAEFSRVLAKVVGREAVSNRFPLILGGDCSILIGVMAALKAMGDFGLLFIDAHADFYEPHQSPTGEAADMELGIVMGKGPDSLANIDDLRPYVEAKNVFQIGQRDMKEAELNGSSRLQDTGATCIDYDLITATGIDATISDLIRGAQSTGVIGYWLHFDTDVIADDENPAVDYRLAGGLTFYQCELLLGALMKALPITGVTITIFNPTKDVDGIIGKRIVRMFENCLNS